MQTAKIPAKYRSETGECCNLGFVVPLILHEHQSNAVTPKSLGSEAMTLA